MAKGNKKNRGPTFAERVASAKAAGPRIQEDPEAARKETPLWCFRRVALSGRFGWTTIGDESERRTVYGGLRNYGSMRWNEIEQAPSCHPVEVEDLTREIREAILREVPNLESAYQLRIGGKGRVFGVRTGRVLSIVLYDREHEGLPVELKNT